MKTKGKMHWNVRNDIYNYTRHILSFELLYERIFSCSQVKPIKKMQYTDTNSSISLTGYMSLHIFIRLSCLGRSLLLSGCSDTGVLVRIVLPFRWFDIDDGSRCGSDDGFLKVPVRRFR